MDFGQSGASLIAFSKVRLKRVKVRTRVIFTETKFGGLANRVLKIVPMKFEQGKIPLVRGAEELQFTPRNEREVELLARFLSFSKHQGGAAASREIAGDLGHFTVAAHILNEDGSKVLLVFGAKEGRWKRPGSHIETDARQAAVAEASRALGRPVGPPDVAIYALAERQVAAYWNTPAHLHFEIVFRFVASESDDLPRGARWFSWGEMPPELIF